MINHFYLRVLTHTPDGSACLMFSGAEPGSVWDEIFKKNMKIEESCIGIEKALKQMVESEKLYTTFYQMRGKEPCSGVFFRDLLDIKIKLSFITVFNNLLLIFH